MAEFKVPTDIPQDLWLIQELVGTPVEKPVVKAENVTEATIDDDISSSDDGDSEDEIEADLVTTGNDSEPAVSVKPMSEPSDSSSESSSSDSDSDSEELNKTEPAVVDQGFDDDEDDPVPGASSGLQFHTKHEVLDADIHIPAIDKIDQDEHLEKVGEIISIVDQIAIIRGLPSESLSRGSERTLDSDTLLVFDDRTVMGYIYETFGPTSQPLYQVKFNSKLPLDTERVKIDRAVYMVPARSNFVFVAQINAIKGSDASNVYDEEPADDELEFSDDEAEAAFRSRLKRKRAENRSRSVASSRDSTPNPSHMRDQQLVDDAVFSRNAYDEHGPYDVDFSNSGPLRPPPIPYDDPYANPFEAETKETSEASSSARPVNLPLRPPAGDGPRTGRPQADGPPHSRGRGRGGRGRGQSNRGRSFSGGGNGLDGRRGYPSNHNQRPPSGQYPGGQQQMSEPYDFRPPQNLPQSSGMAHHGHYSQNAGVQQSSVHPDAGPWGYNPSDMVPQAPFNFTPPGFQSSMGAMSFVQPHINPRFASAFGVPFQAQGQNVPVGYSNQFATNSYGTGMNAMGASAVASSGQLWSNQWAPSMGDPHPPSTGESGNHQQSG